MATELGPIGQIHLSVTDFALALPFYRDVLRLPLLFEAPERKMACLRVRWDQVVRRGG